MSMKNKNIEIWGWFWDGTKLYYVQSELDRINNVSFPDQYEFNIASAITWKYSTKYKFWKDRVSIHGGSVWVRSDDPILSELGCVKGMRRAEIYAAISEHTWNMAYGSNKTGVYTLD